MKKLRKNASLEKLALRARANARKLQERRQCIYDACGPGLMPNEQYFETNRLTEQISAWIDMAEHLERHCGKE